MDGPLRCELCSLESEGMDRVTCGGTQLPAAGRRIPEGQSTRTSNMTNRATRSRRTFTLVLLACLAVSLICVAYPIYVIRPFRHQGARELVLALVVIRFRPVITVITAMAAIVSLIGSWRAQPLKWSRVL